MKTIKWLARILALCILIFALPFYFGYGKPLPFVKSDYSLWENVALAMMPLVFIGLALGWKYPKVAGWLIIISIAIGFIVGLLTEANLSINLAVPIIPGILYLIDGYKRETKSN
jgi:thiamine transporter ThiT